MRAFWVKEEAESPERARRQQVQRASVKKKKFFHQLNVSIMLRRTSVGRMQILIVWLMCGRAEARNWQIFREYAREGTEADTVQLTWNQVMCVCFVYHFCYHYYHQLWTVLVPGCSLVTLLCGTVTKTVSEKQLLRNNSGARKSTQLCGEPSAASLLLISPGNIFHIPLCASSLCASRRAAGMRGNTEICSIKNCIDKLYDLW